MAYNEFIKNIKLWQLGEMKTIDFYHQILVQCFNETISGIKMPATIPAVFSSWFLGKDKTPYTSGVVLEPSPPSAITKKYPNYNSPVGAIGFSSGQVFNNSNSLITEEYDLTDGRLVAYLEIVPMSQYLIDYRLRGYRFVRCIPIAGTAYKTIDIITDSGISGVKTRYISAAGWYPEIADNDYSLPTHNFVYDDTISSLVTVKKLEYYFVKKDGTREKLNDVSPCFPFVVNGKYVCEPLVNNSIYDKKDFNFINYTCNGIGEISLPSGYTHPTTSSTNIYAFTINQSTGCNHTSNSNYGRTFFCSSRDQLLSYLGQITNISAGAEFLQDFNAPINHILLDISKCESIYCPFNLQYVAVVGENAVLRTNQIFTTGARFFGGGASLPSNIVAAGGSFQTFKEIFEDWGIYCTDNLDEVLYGEIPPLPPTSSSGGNSGFDDNLPPTGNNGDDVPSNIPTNPENRIDDFVVTKPNISPAVLCYSYVYALPSVQQLFKWLCSTSYIENQSELFADKLSAIYGLILYPFDFVVHDESHLTATDTTTIVKVSEQISGYILRPDYNTIINGGEISYLSYYGNYADWIKCAYSVYVPYGGIIEIPSSAIVNRRLTLTYSVDLMTGKATAILKSYALGNYTLGVLVKLVPCQIGQLVPIQSSSYGQREISNTLSSISLLGSSVNMIAAGAKQDVGGLINGMLDFGMQAAEYTFNQQLTYCATGSLSPSTGLGLSQTPYLSISRGYLATPKNYRQQNGIPTAYFSQLSAVSTGSNFIRCENVYLDIIRATSAEIDEIRSLLSSGVYI